MRVARYISIVLFLALGCAGRADKMRGESEIPGDTTQREAFKPAYPELIAMYNEGRVDEFYSVLDTMRIKNPSSVIRSVDPDGEEQANPYSFYLAIPMEITSDSSLASILILDAERKLLWIEHNNIVRHGSFLYFAKLPNIESGVYHYLLKVDSETTLKNFVLLK
jgi:hypothetical protein